MRETNKIYNEDCMVTIAEMNPHTVDVVLTSPFYNTNKKASEGRTLLTAKVKQENYHYLRYDEFVDNMTNEEYCEFTKKLFDGFDRILKPNGIVLYNINYGTENADGMFKAIYKIITETEFTIADVIVWKKKSALPNSASPNKLTRIWEFVFVFCRKDEWGTFICNKEVKSYRPSGQAMYENMFNMVEAKNNDESCPLNKATYSTELCQKLLAMYAPRGGLVYDPFMGTGTTAVACYRMGMDYIGSELSSRQCEWAENRMNEETAQIRFF